VLDLRKLEKGKLARLRRLAEQAAAAYALVSWAGPVPDEFVEQAAVVYNAMSDAPRSAEIAAEEWDAQRVRERINDLRPRFGMHNYAVAEAIGYTVSGQPVTEYRLESAAVPEK